MRRLKRVLSCIGPGFITGASDDDPSGILTYAQTGASFGYRQLWVALFSLPFMIVVQEMCGRIGLVTGKGLSGVIRHHYSRGLLTIAIALLFVANTINIGADLGAMASSAELLTGWPFGMWLLFMALLTLLLEVFISYPLYARYLKYLTLSLLAYVAVAFIVRQPWPEVMHSLLVPTFSWDREFLMNIVALLGTTISPYLFFWQADEEVEEEVERHQLAEMGIGIPTFSKKDIATMRLDTGFGMIFSNLVTFFIIVTAASTLPLAGIMTIETAAQGAEALRPIGGMFASLLFALGVIGTGLLAVPVLAGSAAYAFSESFGWQEGLSKKWWQAKGFYAVICISTLVGAMVNFTGIPPFRMLYYTAILNGITAPVFMVLILRIANDSKILGKYVNRGWVNVLGILITVFMTLCAVALIADMLFGS